MKRLTTLLLAAGLVFGISTGSAQAIDFKASGQWLMGFNYGDPGLVGKIRNGQASKKQAKSTDKFAAGQRIRLKLEAVASENLSGTLYFEMGDTQWGHKASGGALGADEKIVEVKNAYLDWTVPDTTLKFRMGVQGVALPSVAGGSAVLDDDVAGVLGSVKFNENVGLTFGWIRPYNDNYDGSVWGGNGGNNRKYYLDNVDVFLVSLPLTFDGIQVTPWVAYGLIGQNSLYSVGSTYRTSFIDSGYRDGTRWKSGGVDHRPSNAYADAFFAGLPIKLSLWDPFNFELDLNYGYVGSTGYGWAAKGGTLEALKGKRFDTRAEGWLVKALFEYKMDWGTPGIFGWYASGDDDNPKNGSERMPSISPCANFTSFMGDGNYGWSAGSSDNNFYDRSLTYAGTWGIGLQLKDMSFLEDLKHTFRVAWRGGTNSPSMAKYALTSYAWANGVDYSDGTGANELYLTTMDSLLEFNLVNNWKVYENFNINLELGYIVNMIDHDTWKKANRYTHFEKQDAWKAQLIFAYQF